MAKQEKMFALVERWRRSGMSKAEFARQIDLTLNTFYYWCRRFEERQSLELPEVDLSAPGFVEIAETQGSQVSAAPRLRVEYPDAVIITVF